MRRIAFILGSMGRGGAERVISILANEYAGKGWNVDICILLENRWEYELNRKIRKINLTGNTKSRIKRIPYWITGIRKYYKNESPDIIVSFVARINALVQLACIKTKAKIIVSERSDPFSDGRKLPIRLINNFFYPKAKKVVLQTERAKSYFNRRVQQNSAVIKNPVIITQEASKERNRKIVTAGRLSEEKNQELLIRAFKKIASLHPEYQLWIYGEGGCRNRLEESVVKLGLSEKVFLPGVKEDIHREMADAEIFVLSSNYEGLSNALMEAMMMGLPCISTNVGGADEIIEDGVNGMIIPVGDEKKLYEAMLDLIENKEKADHMGIAAKKSSEQYNAESVLRQWREVIEQS